MAVCTLKTKNIVSSIHELSVPSFEIFTAIEYEDKKVEVFNLGRDCSPVLCEEESVVTCLVVEAQAIVVVVNKVIDNEDDKHVSKMRICFWNAVSPLGFNPKEITCKENDEDLSLDGKLKLMLRIPNDNIERNSLSNINVASLRNQFCISYNSRIMWIFSAKLENSMLNVSLIQTIDLQLGENSTEIRSIIFFKHEESTDCLLWHSNGLKCYMSTGSEGFQEHSPDWIKSLPQKIAAFRKVDDTRFLILSSNHDLYAFKSPDIISKIRLPNIGSTCHLLSVCLSAAGQGTIALCRQNHTIYLFDLYDIYLSVGKINNGYTIPPLKVIFCKIPVNSICLVDPQTLLTSSSTSPSLTTWAKLR